MYQTLSPHTINAFSCHYSVLCYTYLDSVVCTVYISLCNKLYHSHVMHMVTTVLYTLTWIVLLYSINFHVVMHYGATLIWIVYVPIVIFSIYVCIMYSH